MASIVKIFKITIPQKKDLCCAICKIVNNDNSLKYSSFCSNKLQCRKFLQETPQAIIAPIANRKIIGAGGSLYVIVTKEFFENCTFQDHCDALNIQIIDLLNPIPTYVYKACLLYTMECKLSPQWNKVGLYLVEGRDFLSSTGCVSAITLNIKEIHDNNARLQVETVNLKIPFVRLNTAHQYDTGSLVRVLPSMKMANVLHISKEITKKHLFKDYEHLRAYWKDMYGYVLPDYDEKFLYYEIEFLYFKSNVLIYPEVCLASGSLQILQPSADPISVIYKFAGELRAKVPKLCGQQLDVCPENTFAAAVLAYTPLLSKTDRSSGYDTGYGTQTRRVNSVTPFSRISETSEIPIKRARLTLSNNNNFLTREIRSDDFDFGTSSTCSTSKFYSLEDCTNITAIDSTIASKSIVEDRSKSRYFEQEEWSFNKSPLESEEDEEQRDKLTLKERLLRNTGHDMKN